MSTNPRTNQGGPRGPRGHPANQRPRVGSAGSHHGAAPVHYAVPFNAQARGWAPQPYYPMQMGYAAAPYYPATPGYPTPMAPATTHAAAPVRRTKKRLQIVDPTTGKEVQASKKAAAEAEAAATKAAAAKAAAATAPATAAPAPAAPAAAAPAAAGAAPPAVPTAAPTVTAPAVTAATAPASPTPTKEQLLAERQQLAEEKARMAAEKKMLDDQRRALEMDRRQFRRMSMDESHGETIRADRYYTLADLRALQPASLPDRPSTYAEFSLVENPNRGVSGDSRGGRSGWTDNSSSRRSDRFGEGRGDSRGGREGWGTRATTGRDSRDSRDSSITRDSKPGGGGFEDMRGRGSGPALRSDGRPAFRRSGKEYSERPVLSEAERAAKMFKRHLKTSENAWNREAPTDEIEGVLKQIKGILNKLTMDNFEKLSKQLLDINMTSREMLVAVIGRVFDEALNEPTFGPMFAELCKHLSANTAAWSFLTVTQRPDGKYCFSGGAKDSEEVFDSAEKAQQAAERNTNFKRILLNKCQAEFERKDMYDELEEEAKADAANTELDDRERKMRELLRAEKHGKIKRRALGNIRFIGELYKQNMLTPVIMHRCITQLLNGGDVTNLDEENLEALCKLLTTIGKTLERHADVAKQRGHPQMKQQIDRYFKLLQQMADDKKLASRLRFMCVDVIELRGARWQPRHGEKKLKTVAEFRADERKREEREARQAAQHSRNGRHGGRRNDRRDDRSSRSRSTRGGPAQASRHSNSRGNSRSDDAQQHRGPSSHGPKTSLGNNSSNNNGSSGRHGQSTGRDAGPAASAGRPGDRWRNNHTSASPVRSGRRQSPAAPRGRSHLSSGSGSGAPAAAAAPAVEGTASSLDPKKLLKRVHNMVEECISTGDPTEMNTELKELGPAAWPVVVKDMFQQTIEGRSKEFRDGCPKVMALLCQGGNMNPASIDASLTTWLAAEMYEDAMFDCPAIGVYIGRLVGAALPYGKYSLAALAKKFNRAFVKAGHAGDILASCLSSAAKFTGEGLVSVPELLAKAPAVVRSGCKWVAPGKLAAAVDTLRAAGALESLSDLHMTSQICARASTGDVDSVLSFVSHDVDNSLRAEDSFVVLTFASLIDGVLAKNTPDNREFDLSGITEGVNNIARVLKLITDREGAAAGAALRKRCVSATQAVVNGRKNRSGVLSTIFTALFNTDVVTKEVFTAWMKDDADETPGRGRALGMIEDFAALLE